MKLKSEAVTTIPKLVEKAESIPEAFTQFSKLPDCAFIRLPVIKRLYGISSASTWRYVKSGIIPKPYKLSQRCTAWRVSDIRADLAAKAV